MADTKLSALSELATTPADTDEVYIRDVSEAAADESKRITVANLMAAAGGASIASGTYSGNQGDDRQITTGFVCKIVILWDRLLYTWICISTTGSIRIKETNQIADLVIIPSADLVLHASNGFVVDGSFANQTGDTYDWVALG